MNHLIVYYIVFVCFHVDETSKDAEYKLAQSGDATCNGLDSAEVCNTRMTKLNERQN